ncbi:hypothetical protein MM221_07960 [Salipaludibacillus sp. LMS25]|nr:hypothetical protein [Salipaludibacillus sp. LMS25]UTR16465.1 hypothetical protein MM221_07960 [Salipaludibacillus sp. LMS25]
MISDKNIWYLITDDEIDFSGSRILALTEDGLFDELYVDDDFKIGH